MTRSSISYSAKGDAISAAPYDIARLRADVKKDEALLRDFASRGAMVTKERDPKLAELASELLKILEQSEAEALDERDER